jgi:creatinine amidohydrolase/Fe(II)-dependent formamide hydrolase-like protein
MRFPGTLTVPDDVFQKSVEYAARSLKAHGFRHIVLLGDHGSTQSGQSAVATRLNREWASASVRVHAVGEYYRASQDEFRQLLKARGYRDDELGSHAALTDTSLMLAVDPRLVRMDRLRRGTGPAGDGVDGDPGRASAELGRLGVEAIVARTVSAVKTAIARP